MRVSARARTTLISMISKEIKKPTSLLIIVVTILLGLIPLFVTTKYFLHLALLILMYAILSMCWNLSAGYTGVISLGNHAIFGLGAYACALSMINLKIGPFFSIIFGGIVATFIATVICLPLLKLRGAYFAIATMALAEIFRIVTINWDVVTGGGRGLKLPNRPYSIVTDYYSMLITLVILIIIVVGITRSKIGFALIAIREEEDGAKSMGINVTRYKVLAWSISCLFTSLAGALFAYYLIYIDPTVVFSTSVLVNTIVPTIFGGIGTIFGPLLGSVILVLLSEYTRVTFLYFHMIIYGVVLILFTLFMRGGIIGFLRRILEV